MIFVTGDCHGDWRRFELEYFPEQVEMTRDDFVIIVGDFGIWNGGVDEEIALNRLAQKPFTTLFIDGNHENFDRLLGDEFREVDFHGGKAKLIRNNIIYLERGYVYELQNKKFFVFGGAASHDIRDGVFAIDGHTRHLRGEDNGTYFRYVDKDFGTLSNVINAYRNTNGISRVQGWSWWREEMPCAEEMQRGIDNLDAVGNQVDFVLTHCAPTEIVSLLFPNQRRVSDTATRYLTSIANTTDFKKWFFGHYHDNRNFGRYILLYEQIIQIA